VDCGDLIVTFQIESQKTAECELLRGTRRRHVCLLQRCTKVSMEITVSQKLGDVLLKTGLGTPSASRHASHEGPREGSPFVWVGFFFFLHPH